jgi:4-diphosphocytidyl-2-C-methyl-D-erythritol kinase
MSKVFLEAAPAKINLALHVTGRRPDGYHSLESLMVFAEISDELEASAAERDSLQVVGPFATALGSGGTNLVMRAVAAFRERWPGHVPFGLALTLRKNLPVAAGLGGGSADAAAALRLLDGLGKSAVPGDELLALALELGADVPACLLSRPCEVRGIGEIVEPLASFPLCHVVLVNPLIPVATADIFRRMQSRDNPPMPALPDPMTLPIQLGIWLEVTRNDLEPAAVSLVPEIGEMLDTMRLTQGCILSRMSGSGATVFGLFGSSPQAHQAAHDLRAAMPGYWVAAAPLILPG